MITLESLGKEKYFIFLFRKSGIEPCLAVVELGKEDLEGKKGEDPKVFYNALFKKYANCGFEWLNEDGVVKILTHISNHKVAILSNGRNNMKLLGDKGNYFPSFYDFSQYELLKEVIGSESKDNKPLTLPLTNDYTVMGNCLIFNGDEARPNPFFTFEDAKKIVKEIENIKYTSLYSNFPVFQMNRYNVPLTLGKDFDRLVFKTDEENQKELN